MKKKKKVIVEQRKLKYSHGPQRGPDTKTNHLNLNFKRRCDPCGGGLEYLRHSSTSCKR
jgi:hypothetical protein